MIRLLEKDEDVYQQEGEEEAAVRGEAAEKPKRNSKLPSETVVLLVLCVLLAAALIIIITLYMMKVQTLREENEVLRKNLSEITWRDQPTPPPPSCPPPETHNKRCLELEGDWETHGGKCYYFSTCGLTWQNSRSLCRDVGGDLVKINSREEQEFLMRKLKNMLNEKLILFWIGLTDSETDESWLWADGSPLNESLSFWSPGQPQNWKGDEPYEEDCVMVIIHNVSADLNTWHDFSCSYSSRIICEKPAGSAQSSCV